jgi:hypothetical protein
MEKNMKTVLYRQLATILLVDVVLPYVVYLVLTNVFGMAQVPALCWSAVPPAAQTLHQVLRNRRVDVFGVLVLVTLVVGVVFTLLTDSPRLGVVRDGFLGLGIGLAMLGSLLIRRPLLHRLVRSLRQGDPAELARFDRRCADRPALRAALRTWTLVWGLALVAGVGVRVALAFTLPVGTSLPLTKLIEPVLLVVLVVLTRRAVGPHLAAEPAAPAVSSTGS